MTSAPSFSVIVPAWNAERTIARCVKSLKALEPSALEILVVDDGSTDGTAAIAESDGATVIRLPSNVGPGLARNEGARRAVGEYLAFTDADCEVPSSWLAAFQRAFERGDCIAVTGPYSGTSEPGLLEAVMDRVLRFNQRSMPDLIESCITANLCVRRADFESVGGFPSYRLPGSSKCCFTNEDEELMFLLCERSGRPARWLPENGVLHAYRATVEGYFRQQAKYAESVLVSYARFPGLTRKRVTYGRSGTGLKILLALLAIVSASIAPVLPVAALGLIPFLALHAESLRYLAATEPAEDRRRLILLAAYPFHLLTALAWTAGLAAGAVKASVGWLAWRKERAISC